MSNYKKLLKGFPNSLHYFAHNQHYMRIPVGPCSHEHLLGYCCPCVLCVTYSNRCVVVVFIAAFFFF